MDAAQSNDAQGQRIKEQMMSGALGKLKKAWFGVLYLAVSLIQTNCVLCWLVDDEVVVDLVKKQIDGYEKKNQSWIIEGFPRTKVQASSLQGMGIIPDKFVNITVPKAVSVSKIKFSLGERGSQL